MSLPWFPFYVDDFLASPKVRRMDAQQVGTYLLLILEQWQSGKVTGELDELARLTNSTPAVVEKVLAECFERSGRGWVNRRMESIQKESAEKSEKARRAAEARWGKDADADAYADAMQPDMPERCYPEPDPDAQEQTTAAAPPAEVVEKPTYTAGELLEQARVRLGLGRLDNHDQGKNRRLLNEWLYSSAPRKADEIMLAIQGLADMRDRELVGWEGVRRDTPMTLAALVKAETLDHTGDGAVRYMWDVAVEHGRRLGAARAPTPRVKGSQMQRVNAGDLGTRRAAS